MKLQNQYTCFLAFLLTISLIFTQGFSQSEVVKNCTFYSQIMNREMRYSLLLPENYKLRTDSFPVIYLLHGFGGDQNSWIVRCKINEMVDSLKSFSEIRDFIYIMPEAGNSYYINNYDSTVMISDYLSQELVPEIDSLYRTEANAASRALVGLSMGGYGAIINTIKHYQLFGSVVAMSASVRTESMIKMLPQARYEKYYGSVFGSGLTDTARITEHLKDNSPYYLMDTCLASDLKKINWYIDCGLNDFLLSANEEFHQLLMKYDIPHEYHVRPGMHNWAYWYKSTARGIIYLNEKFSD